MSEKRRLGHDIRNSMNALQLHAQVLQLCDGSELLESIDAIIDACDQLMRMMDELDQLPDHPTAPVES